MPPFLTPRKLDYFTLKPVRGSLADWIASLVKSRVKGHHRATGKTAVTQRASADHVVVWLQRSQMFIETGHHHDSRSSGAQCFPVSPARVPDVSLRWSEEGGLDCSRSINVTSPTGRGNRVRKTFLSKQKLSVCFTEKNQNWNYLRFAKNSAAAACVSSGVCSFNC